MRKLLLILFLLVAATAQATTIQMQNPNWSTMVIPDGSVITSQTYQPPGFTMTGRWMVDFTFADGYGGEWDDYNDGSQGWIRFNVPVENLTINWYVHGTFQMPGWFTSCRTPYSCPEEGVFTFSGPVSTFQWSTFDGSYGGVSSMSYEVPQQVMLAQQAAIQQVPEPSSLALLPLGLAGLWMARRRRN